MLQKLQFDGVELRTMSSDLITTVARQQTSCMKTTSEEPELILKPNDKKINQNCTGY